MNSQSHWLSALAVIVHLTIGLADWIRIGPRFLPPSWQVIYMILPNGWDWIYPALWVLTGIVAAFGVRWPAALRLGYQLSSLLFLSWAIAGVPAMTQGLGGNLQGIAANVFLAGLAAGMAHYVTIGEQGDAVNVQVARLAEQAYQADDRGG